MNRAYYSGPIGEFIATDSNTIEGILSSSDEFQNLALQQRNAWRAQIFILKNSLQKFSGSVYSEYNIPRMGRRADNIVIIGSCIFVLEFKIGSTTYDNYAREQVLGYGLDLNNFHSGSHNQIIIPILVADSANNYDNELIIKYENLYDTLNANQNNLSQIISNIIEVLDDGPAINIDDWENSPYKPTPTIVEAATILYQKHSVAEISRNDAGAINLTQTNNCVAQIIDHSKSNYRKSICFVTGVPGAGKTLAGLNIANTRANYEEQEHAVFLSGNMPLVAVLQEALIQDQISELKNTNRKGDRKLITSKIKSFIQLIHHFRDSCLSDSNPPIEKVTIFDEAQRAWTMKKTSDFMKQKKGQENFNKSEPEFLIEVMDRHIDWCTIVCLIGGGQEINTGEAGLEEWIHPLINRFCHWDIYFSPEIVNHHNYLKDASLIKILSSKGELRTELHLAISLRSFRSEQLSSLVNFILENNLERAKELFEKYISTNYPIKITRNIDTAKKWLKQFEFGTNRTGMVASSGARRLRPFGVNIKEKIDAPKWFLNPKQDIRSSFYLEEVATEFDIQGLELDYTCVAWDGNFFHDGHSWNCKKFTGSSWKQINNANDRNYLFNSYRVLLTRARQGMVVFIPFGSNDDHTRPSNYYDGTYNFLKLVGFEEI